MQIVLGINTAEFSATSTWVVCRIKDSSEHNVLYVPWGVDNLCMCAAWLVDVFQHVAPLRSLSSRESLSRGFDGRTPRD